MKYYPLQLTICLALCTLFPLKSIAASNSCLPEGIKFTSQKQIDSFRMKFPDCTMLLGNVTIENGDITHLDSLESIISISGDLYISSYLLADLKGLENLYNVSGDVFIGSYYAGFSPVQSIVTLQGLNSLTEVGGNIEVVNCDLLVSMEGLEGLTIVHGNVMIWGNDRLQSMDGLENVRIINGDFIIGLKSYHSLYAYGNPALENLSSLTNLEEVRGSLQIAGNVALRSLEGLNRLKTIGGSLAILANDNLTNLTGLDSLREIGESLWVGTDGWWIENGKNNSLTDLSGLQSLAHIGQDVLIFGSQALTSVDGLQNVSTLNGNLAISGEGISTLSGLESLELVSGTLNINAESLINFEALQNLTSVMGDLNIHGCNRLTSLSGLFSLKKIGGSLLIYDNYRLQSLAGLGVDLDIQRDVRIGIESESGDVGNKYLTDLTPLKFLEGINGTLQISGNISLSSLAGLDRIAYIRDTLQITGNPSLQTCNITLICNHLSSGKQCVIQNNATGCDNIREVHESCSKSINEYSLNEDFKAECFPNPTNGIVHIRTSTKGLTTVIVVNPAGQALNRKVLNGDGSIDLSDYAEGLYFLHISNQISLVVLPVVKNSL